MKFKHAIALIFLVFLSSSSLSQSSLLTERKYENFRKNFLDLSQGVYEIDMDALSQSEYASVTANLNQSYGSPYKHSYGISAAQSNDPHMKVFGAGGACTTKSGEKAACFFTTGGSVGGKNATHYCGGLISSGVRWPLPTAEQGKVCDKNSISSLLVDNQIPWASGGWWWFGLYNNSSKVKTGFIRDKIPNASNHALNRMCVELEIDSDNFIVKNSVLDADTRRRQVVNGSVAPNLANLQLAVGTYTSPITKVVGDLGNEASSEEQGGHFGREASHYYHKIYSHTKYPTSKSYAIDKDTLIYCAGDNPTGVRGAMGNGYVNNPIADIVPSDADGTTGGFNYWNYVTRAYMLFDNTNNIFIKNYPLAVKLKRVFMLYEPNDIVMVADNGKSTVSNKFARRLTPAQEAAGKVTYTLHNVVVKNFAPNSRDYMFYLNVDNNNPAGRAKSEFKVFIDANNNGSIDSGEVELAGYDTITLVANTDMHLIIKQENYFHKQWRDVHQRNNRRVINNKIGLRELGRLRSTGMSIRTWQILPNETLDEARFLRSAPYRDISGRIRPVNLSAGVNYSFDIIKGWDEKVSVNVTATSSSLADLKTLIKTSITNQKSADWVDISVVDGYLKFSKRYTTYTFEQWSRFEHSYAYPEGNLWYKHGLKNSARADSPYLIKNTVDYKKMLGKSPKPVESLSISQ